MTFNGVLTLYCVILLNSVALLANYAKVVEDRVDPCCLPQNCSYKSLAFSERELKFMFAICHWPSVCLSVYLSSVVCNVGAPYSGD